MGAPLTMAVTEFLRLCCQTKNLRVLKEFHAHVVRSRFFSISGNLQIKLLIAYSSCLGDLSPGILTCFLKCISPRNPLPFNEIISHFSRNGCDLLALHTFSFMRYIDVFADSYTLCSSVKSASSSKSVSFGKSLHAHVEKSGWLASVFVGSALVDFYSKLSFINNAAKVFDEIPVKNTVCVNALLSGFSEAKMWDHVIELVRTMLPLNLVVDNFTLSSILRACVSLSAMELGKQVHAKAIRIDAADDVFLQSLLIEAYGKCGVVENAEKVFSLGGSKRDLIIWTSMLSVYGRTGNYLDVTNLFNSMLLEGINPDGVAFLAVISACRYNGQVNLGMEYFESMIKTYRLVPSQEHYSCVVDMLCRGGDLARACEFVTRIPETGDKSFSIAMWGALISACSETGNISFGKMVAERALELNPSSVGIYLLLSNMYGANDMWSEIENLRELMKSRGLKKNIGWSCI